ncbi:MAG TPA: exosortase-associated EpsI family protein [Gemmataceae bacterium]|jgi:hypothetical protein|nr:exosortase-associated EpsI family protein [Gemmataceae bacterium]
MRFVLVILAFLAVIVPGVGHGLLTDRWFVSTQLQDFTTRLANVPMDIQDWQGENVVVDPRQIAHADLAGYVGRRFTHRTSRFQLSILLTCGRPGPVSVHSPDICYGGAGYKIQNPESTFSLGSTNPALAGEFYESTFVKAEPIPEFLEIYWAWNCRGPWEIPARPRVAFGAQPALYKLYVICPFSKDSQRKETQEACKSFFEVLLPELRKTLF